MSDEKDTAAGDIDLVNYDGPIGVSNEVPGGPREFFHPRAYINEDGEVAIWVGTPPGVAPYPSDLTGEVLSGSVLTDEVGPVSSTHTVARAAIDRSTTVRDAALNALSRARVGGFERDKNIRPHNRTVTTKRSRASKRGG
jgi:hypothetical protein